jgi:hypothetical protein
VGQKDPILWQLLPLIGVLVVLGALGGLILLLNWPRK